MVARPRHVVTIEDAAADFLVAREMERRSPATIALYRHVLKTLVAFVGPVAVANLDAATLRRWLQTFAERGRTATTQADYLRVVKNFLRWAAAEGHDVDAATLARVKAPRLDTEEVQPFSPAEVARLYQACQTGPWLGLRQRATLSLLLDTGLRASELCGLRLGDVDLASGLVEVRAATSKSRKGRRVMLGRRAQRDLDRWFHLRRDKWSAGAEEPFFCGRYGRALTPRTLLRLFHRLGRRAGVEDCHPHRCRHTFALRSLEAGLSVFEVQALLGHSDLSMTRRYVARIEADVNDAKRAKSWLDRAGARVSESRGYGRGSR